MKYRLAYNLGSEASGSIFNTWSLYSLRCEDFTEEVFKTEEKWPQELKGQRRDSPVGGGGSSALWVEVLTS